MIILIPLLYVLVGYSLFATIHHVMIANRGIRVELHYNFALVNFILLCYVLSTIFLYKSITVYDYLFVTRFQAFLIPLFLIFYTKFSYQFIGKEKHQLFWVISSLFLLIPIVRQFSSSLLTYYNIIGVNITYMPWGEQISQLDASVTLFGYFYFLIIFIAMGYNVSLTLIALREKKTKRLSIFLATQLIFFVAAINDLILEIYNFNWIYLGAFGFCIMVFAIGEYMSASIYDSSILRKKLIESERLLTSIIENSPLVINIKDIDGRYILTNHEFDDRFVSKNTAVVGKTDYEIFDKPVADSIRMNDYLVKNNKKSIQLEEVIPIDGKSHFFTSTRFLIYGDEGEVFAIVGIATDITNKKLMERQLRQSEKMQAIGQLAGGVAHDFNNQLAGIIGNADLLVSENMHDFAVVNYAKGILAASKRASELTDQLLAFARKGKYNLSQIDIHEIIDETVDLLKRSIDKKITLQEKLNAKSPFVKGDSTQIQNAILNICINARDAMGHGGVISILTEDVILDKEFCDTISFIITPGEYLKIVISDIGTGIAPDILDKIFEPFFTTKEIGKGTGMGLAAVYGTVKNHHGAIMVESEVGEGTTVKLLIPKFSDGQIGDQVIKTNPEPEVEIEIDNKQDKVGTILVVDDEKLVLNAISGMLESFGYNVKLFDSGYEMIDYYEENFDSIDLIIMDMIMPEINGTELFYMLKEIDPNVAVLLSSGYSIDGEAQVLIEDGAKEFLHKPFRMSELDQKVSGILDS